MKFRPLLMAMIAVAGFGLVSSSAKASLLTADTGNTQPFFGGSGAHGFIDFAVYQLNAGAYNPSDPYGAGLSAATLSGDGINPHAEYLYLYQAVDKDTDISQVSIAYNSGATGGAGAIAGYGFTGITFAHPSIGPPAPAGNPSTAVTGQTTTISATAGLVAPTAVTVGTSSIQATFGNNLSAGNGQVSSLWGVSSNQAPSFLTASIVDHGTSAVGAVPSFSTPEPSGMILAAIGTLGLVGYGLRRRKARTA